MDLALFDFDGTITFQDTFTPFVRRALSPLRLTTSAIRLSPLMMGYACGHISAPAMRKAIIKVGLKGCEKDVLDELGRIYCKEVLRGQIRPEAAKRIAWHKNRGDRIAVVSASLDFYLAPWCEWTGVDLICSKLEVSDGKLTGRYLGEGCTGLEKSLRVTRRYDLSGVSSIYAYGDTTEDEPLLKLATHSTFRWGEQVVKGRPKANEPPGGEPGTS